MMEEGKYLIDLLPYNPDISIRDFELIIRILLFVDLLLREIDESSRSFYVERSLHYFDPHVGDNLCQIRACQILELHLETRYKPDAYLFYIGIKAAINKKKSLVAELLDAYENERNKKLYYSKYKNEKLIDFLNRHNLNLAMPQSLYFITLCSILTKFRTFNQNEDILIDYELLKDHFKISKNIARRLVHRYQKQLSYISYEYILRHSLPLRTMKISRKMLELLHHTDDDGRHTLPCYIVMLVLLNRLKTLKIDILIVVRQKRAGQYNFVGLFYEFNPKLNIYHFKNNINASNAPCFVIHAISESESLTSTGGRLASQLNLDKNGTLDHYISKLNEIGVTTAIMANMAAHPQHSGNSLIPFKVDPFISLLASSDPTISQNVTELRDVFLKMKVLGNTMGFSKTNSTMLYIRHIFPDFLCRQLTLSLNKKFYNEHAIEKIAINTPNIVYSNEEISSNSNKLEAENVAAEC